MIRIIVIDSALLTSEHKDMLDLLSTEMFIGIKVPADEIDKTEFKLQSLFLHYDILILDNLYKELSSFLKDNDPSFFKLYKEDFLIITSNINLINSLRKDSVNCIESDKENLLQTLKFIINNERIFKLSGNLV
jgi:hypothetical protein